MLENFTLNDLIIGIGAGASGLIVGLLQLNRRISRDNVETTKDRAEINVFDAMKEQRDYSIQRFNELFDKYQISLEKQHIAENDIRLLKDTLNKIFLEVTALHELFTAYNDNIDAVNKSIESIKESLIKMEK